MTDKQTAPKAQHTPGPWIGTLFSNGGFFVEADTKPPRLAICERIPLPHLAAESIANALLIAAAPDMYKALKAQEELASLSFIGEPAESIARVRTMRRAAIAKAEGK